MKIDLLVQNLFNLFVLAIIVEIAISAVFSISALKDMKENSAVSTLRDIVVLILAFFICFKVRKLSIFFATGIKIPYMLDTAISALILTGLANVIKNFFQRIKNG